MRAVVEVVPGIVVMTSRRYATTSTLVMGRGEALVVDPSWDPDELGDVSDVIAAAGASCAAGLATHEHYDHVLWHPSLPDVPRWATPWSVDHWRTSRDELLAPLKGDLPEVLIDLAGRLTPCPTAPRSAAAVPGVPYPRDTVLPPEYHLPWIGRDVILHEHDAHARGHVAVEIPDAGVLLAGDMLSDIELPYPDPAEPDLVAYLVGLERLVSVVGRSTMLIPGHGSPTSEPMARLDADRAYLEAILAGRDPDDPRRADPWMEQLHEANVRQARATGPSPPG